MCILYVHTAPLSGPTVSCCLLVLYCYVFSYNVELRLLNIWFVIHFHFAFTCFVKPANVVHWQTKNELLSPTNVKLSFYFIYFKWTALCLHFLAELWLEYVLTIFWPSAVVFRSVILVCSSMEMYWLLLRCLTIYYDLFSHWKSYLSGLRSSLAAEQYEFIKGVSGNSAII